MNIEYEADMSLSIRNELEVDMNIKHEVDMSHTQSYLIIDFVIQVDMNLRLT